MIKMENNYLKAVNLRLKVLDLALKNTDAHLGGSFSEIELLISLFDYLKKDDKFILSKGHACLPYYALLQEKGYNPKILPHPNLDPANGIYCTTGSLGHGLPIGVGMAYAKKIKNEPGNIYVLMGDGECQEGTTWESALIASHYNLENLIAIVDNNKIQAVDWVNKVISLGDLVNKFKSFGWNSLSIDGHCFEDINRSLNNPINQKPYAIIANTIKGKGVSYMENNPEWHARRVTPERVNQAYIELKNEYNRLMG